MYARQALKVSFPPPGFFVTDVRVALQLDGNTVYDGGFRSGFELELPVSPGRHTLMTTIDLGVVQRRRAYTLDVSAGQAKHVLLRYSRFWGNFTRELADFGELPAVSARTFRWGRAGLAFVVSTPLAAVFVFAVAVKIAPPYTADGHAVMAIGQLLLALVLAPVLGACAAAFAGRPHGR